MRAGEEITLFLSRPSKYATPVLSQSGCPARIISVNLDGSANIATQCVGTQGTAHTVYGVGWGWKIDIYEHVCVCTCVYGMLVCVWPGWYQEGSILQCAKAILPAAGRNRIYTG